MFIAFNNKNKNLEKNTGWLFYYLTSRFRLFIFFSFILCIFLSFFLLFVLFFGFDYLYSLICVYN